MAKQKKTQAKKIEPLVGEELLRKVKELGNLSKEEKAKAKSIQNSKFKIQNCE